jgi:hypothetical protein
MASIIPRLVFGEILEIARSDDALRERCQRAEKRIAQFKADLKVQAFVSPTRGSLSKNHLTLELRQSFNSPKPPPDHRVVFLAAIDALAKSED